MMIQRTLSIIIAISLVFSLIGCAARNTTPTPDIIKGEESLAFTSSSSQSEIGQPENPPAVTSSQSFVTSSSSSSQSESSSSTSSGSSQSASQSQSQSGNASSSSASQSASSSTASSQSSQSSQSSSSSQPDYEVEDNESKNDTPVTVGDEIRAVWISYLELGTMLTDQSSSQYRSNIRKACANAAEMGLNTIILQVRPFGDAIYPSAYFPQSYLFNGTEGKRNSAPFDALAIAIEEAHAKGLRLEAWVNPYRVRSTASTKPLGNDNPAQDFLDSGSDAVVKSGALISYNPGNTEAQNHIVNGIIELVKNYDIDGIHFDDYFYPTTDASFDKGTYQSSGTGKSLAQWRRSNVTTLMGKVYNAIKGVDKSVTFGISPQGNNNNNLNAQYVDIAEIAQKGYVDYICPQMYFGFNNSGCPYQSTIESFNKMVKGTGVQLYIGLATYKFGKQDSWAGNGINEWVDTTDIIARQVKSARKLTEYGGFILYRYDSCFSIDGFYTGSARTQAKTEMKNLAAILK